MVVIYLLLGGTRVFLLSLIAACCDWGILGFCSKFAWPGVTDVSSLPLSSIDATCFSV